jgi:hypothetical protein
LAEKVGLALLLVAPQLLWLVLLLLQWLRQGPWC